MFYGTPDHILLHVYASWVSTARRSTHGRADDPENQSHQQDEEHEHDHQRKPVSLLRLPHSWPSPADREDRCQRCGLWFLGIAWGSSGRPQDQQGPIYPYDRQPRTRGELPVVVLFLS